MKTIVFCFIVLFNVCAKAQNLSGSAWTLISIDDLDTGICKDIASTTKSTLKFEGDTAYSGHFCNTFNGNYKYNQDKSIRFGVPRATRMMCMGIDKYEKEMFALFVLVNRYRVEEGKLFLFTSNHKRLTYKKA